MNNELQIPEVSDEEITEVLRTIRPLVKKDEELWYIEMPDPRKVAFTWEPKFKERAEELRPVITIRTLHTFGYYGFFKPSLAEVVAQLPEDVTNIVAFLVEGPETRDDLGKEMEALNAGFHVAQTTLFERVP